MKSAFLIIIVTSLVCGEWPHSFVYAAPPCIEEPDQNPEKTQLLPIVRDQASLQKFNERRVLLVGRYQRVILKSPVRVSRRGLIDPSIIEANKPIPAGDLQVNDTDLGFARIVLADGVSLSIEPRGRQSLRHKSESDKYDGQAVHVSGYAIWRPGSFYEREITNITNLRLVCSATESLSSTINPDEWQGKKLDVAKTKADLLKFIDSSAAAKDDQRVQIVGKYVVTRTWDPGINSNIAEFKGTYQQAGIELVDGTVVPLISPSNKLSVRPAKEVKTYSDKIVKIIGHIALEDDFPKSKNPVKKVVMTSLNRIWLK